MGAVEEYLAALSDRSWERLGASLADEGLVRSGPFVDVIEGKPAYVEFLRRVCSPFDAYRIDVHRVSRSGDRIVYVEIDEVIERGGTVSAYPEILLFELGDDGLIRYVSVFMKRPGGEPSISGGRAT
jgi:hypothetical protein